MRRTAERAPVRRPEPVRLPAPGYVGTLASQEPARASAERTAARTSAARAAASTSAAVGGSAE